MWHQYVPSVALSRDQSLGAGQREGQSLSTPDARHLQSEVSSEDVSKFFSVCNPGGRDRVVVTGTGQQIGGKQNEKWVN